MKRPRDFRLIEWGRKQRTGSAGADACLWHIAGVANSTGRCFMSDAGIAKMCGRGERSITRYLAILRSAGLISIHYERGRRIITFNCAEARHIGCLAPPKMRLDGSQNGGQNLLKRIHSPALQKEYIRLLSIDDTAKRIKAIADFKRRNMTTEGDGIPSG